ncbi:MAG: SH3 domain-containing protein [Proteobacteria bacterium]|nr:SH3 domain-containing protein [Pseudomonadota bacterium]
MKRVFLVSLLALFFLAACSDDSSKRPTATAKPPTSIAKGKIPRDTDVQPTGDQAAEKPAKMPSSEPAKTTSSTSATRPSKFVYAKMTCNIRKGPGTRYSIIRQASKGEKLEYISLKGNWYKLKVAKGKPQQWVHKSVVTPLEKS